jgi:hypothetical protein
MSLTYKAITAVQKCIEDGDGKLGLQMLRHLGAIIAPEPWPVQLAMTDPLLVERMDAMRMGQLAEAMETEEGRLAQRKSASTGGDPPRAAKGSPEGHQASRRSKRLGGSRSIAPASAVAAKTTARKNLPAKP